MVSRFKKVKARSIRPPKATAISHTKSFHVYQLKQVVGPAQNEKAGKGPPPLPTGATEYTGRDGRDCSSWF